MIDKLIKDINNIDKSRRNGDKNDLQALKEILNAVLTTIQSNSIKIIVRRK